MLDPIVKTADDDSKKQQTIDFGLKEDDWKHFMEGARQLKVQRGQYVLKEGQQTATLYQIIRVSPLVTHSFGGLRKLRCL